MPGLRPAAPGPVQAPALPEDLQALTDELADAEAAEQAARKLASSQSGASVTTERALDAAREQLAACRATWDAQLSIGLPEGLHADTVELDEATSERMRAPERAAREQLETAKRELEDAAASTPGCKRAARPRAARSSSAPRRWRPPATDSSAAARS